MYLENKVPQNMITGKSVENKWIDFITVKSYAKYLILVNHHENMAITNNKIHTIDGLYSWLGKLGEIGGKNIIFLALTSTI